MKRLPLDIYMPSVPECLSTTQLLSWLRVLAQAQLAAS